MLKLPLGKCRNCEGPVSYLARACPHCGARNLPNTVATIGGLLALACIGALIGAGVQTFRGKGSAENPPRAESAPTSAAPADGYGWIVAAMAECQEEAKLKRDVMHFLIVPITPTGMSLPGWSPNPISSVGSSAVLLTSSDALIGLRNGALTLYQKPVTFAVSDPKTSTVYKWKPAVGVAVLKARDAGQTNLTLGFEIPDLAKEIEWGPTVNVDRGTCYWINPVIPSAPRSG
ncbi:MAG TPA: hypothetical protein VGF60_19645 [Xanthobacteraceae bacterium]|jgi:hypothetical protein